MIRAVTDMDALRSALGGVNDIYAGKIRALAEGYGSGYDFCRFWVQDGASVLGSYYGGCTAALTGDMSEEDAEELASFLTCGQFGKVLMPYRMCGALGLTDRSEMLCLMTYPHGIKNSSDINKEPPDCDISLGQIYEIVRYGFDIDRDKWYTDISHMLRHGIAEVYALENSSCAVKMFSSGGISYLSYVCTLPERRGNGLAARLLRSICAEEERKGNKTEVLCENTLRQFYEHVGFVYTDNAAEFNIHAIKETVRHELLFQCGKETRSHRTESGGACGRGV